MYEWFQSWTLFIAVFMLWACHAWLYCMLWHWTCEWFIFWKPGLTHIELLICWTCCGVSANAKHVSWKRWLLSDAAEEGREKKERDEIEKNKWQRIIQRRTLCGRIQTLWLRESSTKRDFSMSVSTVSSLNNRCTILGLVLHESFRLQFFWGGGACWPLKYPRAAQSNIFQASERSGLAHRACGTARPN